MTPIILAIYVTFTYYTLGQDDWREKMPMLREYNDRMGLLSFISIVMDTVWLVAAVKFIFGV
jgi:hypothetical protein